MNKHQEFRQTYGLLRQFVGLMAAKREVPTDLLAAITMQSDENVSAATYALSGVSTVLTRNGIAVFYTKAFGGPVETRVCTLPDCSSLF